MNEQSSETNLHHQIKTDLPTTRREFFQSLFKKSKQDVGQKIGKVSTPFTFSRRTLFKSVLGIVAKELIEKIIPFAHSADSADETITQENKHSLTNEGVRYYIDKWRDLLKDPKLQGELKNKTLLLKLARIAGEYAVIVLVISDQQEHVFSNDLDYIDSYINGLLYSELYWNVDPVDIAEKELTVIPPHFNALKTQGRFFASELCESELDMAPRISIVHFGDKHDWDPTSPRFQYTLQGHDQMVKMFETLYQYEYAILGYEHDGLLSSQKAIKNKIANLSQSLVSTKDEKSKESLLNQIKEIKARAMHEAEVLIRDKFPIVSVIPVDVYASDHGMDHDTQAEPFEDARYAYYRACIKLLQAQYAKQNIKEAEEAVLSVTNAYSSLSLRLKERATYDLRYMIGHMLLSKRFNGVMVFGLGDSQFFRQEVKKINDNPSIFLNALKRENRFLYNQLMTLYSIEQIKQLGINFYTVIPNAFLPSYAE